MFASFFLSFLRENCVSMRLGVRGFGLKSLGVLCGVALGLAGLAGVPLGAQTATTTTLAVSAAGSTVTTVTAKTVVTLTATVTVTAGSTAVKVGQVNFCDADAKSCSDVHFLGRPQLTSAGTAVVRFRPAVGTHHYKAVFLGTKSYGTSSTGPSTLTVTLSGKVLTATHLAISGAAGNYTFTATVFAKPDPANLPAPTGTVSFVDTGNANSLLASTELDAGTAGLTWIASSLQTAARWNDAMSTGDFNNDGIPDLAVPGYVDTGSRLVIFIGNGDGTFNGGAENPLNPFASTVGDFNGDGNLDLAVTNFINCSIDILLGNGDGTFTSLAGPGAPCRPSQVLSGDFNGDGIADLVVADSDSLDSGVTVVLGNGDGTFTPVPVGPVVGSAPASIAVGDFNGDGIDDIATSDGGGNDVTILLSNGDGTFTKSQTIQTDAGPGSIVAGDFNGDGKIDLAVAESGTEVVVYLGNGDGTFRANPMGPVPNIAAGGMAIGDFNGDGIADLALTSGGELTVLLGNGDGSFSVVTYEQSAMNAPGPPVVADFNGDGSSDVAAANGAAAYPATQASVPVLLTYTEILGQATGVSLPSSTVLSNVEAKYSGDTHYNPSTSGPGQTITPAPAVSLSVNGEDFDSWPVGSQTAAKSVTLTNVGTAPLAITSIQLGGTNPTSFVAINNCPASLAVGAFCTLQSSFFPTVAGSLSATVLITDNAANSPQSLVLNGFGVGTPQASLSATSLAFGSVDVGTSAAQQSVTLTNPGTGPLTINSIAVTGTNASSFAFANTCGASLAVGASCTISGDFAPLTTGAQTAMVTITDNASTSPQSIALSGTGLTGPVSLSAFSLAFGSVTVGSASPSQYVVVTNSGAAALSITSIAVTGTNASSFDFGNNCGASLAVGATCTIHGHFGPTTGGALTAAITITDSATTSPQTVTLSGTGVPLPLTLSATSLSFAATNVGESTGSQSVTLTDTGTAAVNITSIAVTGADASSFAFANSCGSSLAVGASCTIHGHFAPAKTGALTAAITITNSAANSPQTVALSGTGLTPPVTFSAASLTYATTDVGGASASQTVVLTNNGTAALTITSIAVTGADASSFVFANSCGTSVAAGGTCTIHGHFAPAAIGALTAAITVTDSAATSPQTIALSGTGINPLASLSATSLAFGSVTENTAAESQAVTLTNTGTTALSITSIAVTGNNASEFAFGNDCGTSLAPGSSCTVHGHFAPTALGAASASITITDNALNSPQNIALTGTGVAAASGVTLSATSLPVGSTPTNLVFGSVVEGSTSPSDTVILANTGTTTLSITSIAVSGANASQFVFSNTCGTTVAAGATCMIQGHFGPTAAGAMSASVKITDSDPTSPQTIALSGTGLAASGTVTLSATSLSFPATTAGSVSGSESVTMTNTGAGALAITSITVGGNDPSSFVIANSCGTSLAAGASCTIHGHFAPVASGALTAAVTITDSASGSPQTISLSGSGQ